MTAALFGTSTLCFLVASAGVRTRVLTAAGAAVLLTVLAQIVWTRGSALDFALLLGIPAPCIAGMAYVREVQTKQRTGSIPSSARAS